MAAARAAAAEHAPDGSGQAAAAEPPAARRVLQENVGAAGGGRPEAGASTKPQKLAVQEQVQQRRGRGRQRGAGGDEPAAAAAAAAAPAELEAVQHEGDGGLEEAGPQHGCIAVTSGEAPQEGRGSSFLSLHAEPHASVRAGWQAPYPSPAQCTMLFMPNAVLTPSCRTVDPGVVDLVKSAVRRLRGVRLCSEGREDGAITHLVIGKERRTLKLMLAGTCLARPLVRAGSSGALEPSSAPPALCLAPRLAPLPPLPVLWSSSRTVAGRLPLRQRPQSQERVRRQAAAGGNSGCLHLRPCCSAQWPMEHGW